jgi:phosphoribosylaminoimidazolecarboxamide formyltransferase / IMP cyclohydrolase
MNDQLVVVTRALISVSDKTGLEVAARKLVAAGVQLVSTGGTAATLKGAGFFVRDVSEITQYPEMMDGRVKTLRPRVHGGLLARRDNDAHKKAMEMHGIQPIDLLYVNLYPFEATIAKECTFDEAIENIDVGGPAMIRAAAKNHDFVAVCVEPADLELVLEEIRQHGGVTARMRLRLAQKAFARCAVYDSIISNWLAQAIGETAPAFRAMGGTLVQTLRYGENPHQSAAFYANLGSRYGVVSARQLQGKELSYNNINDTDAAFEAVSEFDPKDGAAVVIVKHANPCGVAVGGTVAEAYQRALACDSTSAFGGIVASNTPLDGPAAEEIVKIFTEVVIAPDADAEARAIFAAKKNLRLLLSGGVSDPRAGGMIYKSVTGGFLAQTRDSGVVNVEELKTVTKREPTEQELKDLLFAFKVAKHVKSNAIIYARDGATVGIGAGQMSRVDSARIAAHKASEAATAAKEDKSWAVGSVCASDAFFPFADGLVQAIEAGATAVIQPGGSMRDEEVIKAADDAGIAMVFTGMRHFRH